MPFLGISLHTRLMLVAEPIREVRSKTRPSGPARRRKALPPLDQVKLHSLRSDQLRLAIRHNLVTFPSQVPVFERHDRPDLQRRIVQLYFLLGWSCETIAARFGLLRQRVGQVLNTWKRRAVEMGYIQAIPPPAAIQGCGRPIRLVLSPVVPASTATPVPGT
jgi:hypothetical protein